MSDSDTPGDRPGKAITTRHLFRSSALVSVMTQVSRVLGMVRDIVLANILGAANDPGADAFFLAFRIPQFLRRLFAEGAFAQAFVPVLSEYRSQRDRAAVLCYAGTSADRAQETLDVALAEIRRLAREGVAGEEGVVGSEGTAGDEPTAGSEDMQARKTPPSRRPQLAQRPLLAMGPLFGQTCDPFC